MSIRVLLDENLEREVYDRLRKIDFVVQHVDEHEKLGKGEDDQTLAEYSLTNETLIVTYDDDFETHYDESEYWGVLFLTDNDWSAAEVSEALLRIIELYPPSELRGMNVVGREWL